MILKIITIIQARTSSTRLPNKVLLSAAGKSLLLHMVERVRKAENSGTVVVATTTDENDNPIEKLCKDNKIEFFRGHPTDLLDRHYQAAINFDGDVVLKIPSDCPLIDPQIIDSVVNYYLENIESYDYVSNLHPPSFPDGNDVEVMSFDALEHSWARAKLDYEREHTTPFIWSNPDLFKIGNFVWNTGLDYSSTHRWTLDYEEDYTFIRLVFEELYNKNPDFSLYDILNLIEKKNYLSRINNKHIGKFWYKSIPSINTKIKLGY